MTENQFQFRKGHLSKGSKNPYQDPTLLSFTIIFDTTSPLFNKNVAVKTLREFYGENARAERLNKFIDTLMLINREMPWYWVSLDGVMKAFEYNLKEPYRGGDDAILSIACNESINLAITGLMDMYREAVYDLSAWTQILPENYKRFRMWVVVSEIRNIATEKPANFSATTAINQDITGDFKPLFKLEYDYCMFDVQSAKETFETLSNASPESPSPKINISYEKVKLVETSYLHGLMTEEIGNQGIESSTPSSNLIRSVGDRLANDAAQIANNAASTLANSIKRANPINLVRGDNNVYGSVLEQLYQQAINEIDGTVSGAARFPRNIFANNLAAAADSASSFKSSLKENIFGEQYRTVGAALRQGSLNAVFPLINKP